MKRKRENRREREMSRICRGYGDVRKYKIKFILRRKGAIKQCLPLV